MSVSAAARYVATKTAPLMLLAHQEAFTSGDLIGYADVTGYVENKRFSLAASATRDGLSSPASARPSTPPGSAPGGQPTPSRPTPA
ncbi:MAG TPA: hypothetical protein VEF72_30600 [Mycobacterium sp.]|nr:hypothetical protein [Mycobacterium sp.]